MKWFLNCVFFILLLLMAASPLQSWYHFIREPGLMGHIYFSGLPDLNAFTMKSWFKGDFQTELQKRIEDHVGFKNSLIRVRNQFDFSLFRMTNAGQFLAGYDNVLLDNEVIYEYAGKYFIGKTPINRKVAELKEIIPQLKD